MKPSLPVVSSMFLPRVAIYRFALALLNLGVPAAFGQSASQTRPEFEVASIRLHPPGDGVPNVSLAVSPGRVTYIKVTVRSLIRQAYGLKVYPLSRGGDALSTDRYDVIAKAPPETSKQQTMLMLQTLLAERFKLAVHHETKELPIYALVLGKNGPKVREVQDDGIVPAPVT
jgi:uncharacterized protein (TIGR03435 family)